MRKSYYGEKSGKLTIIDTRELLTREKAFCKCSCGVEKYVKVRSILYHETCSCGCDKIKDLTGQKFGKLTALNLLPKVEGKKRQWLCLCSCGNYVKVYTSNLLSGDTRSCGCLQKRITSKRVLKDLRGRKFGKLTVISRSGSSSDRRALWLCRCNCGNEIITSGRMLLLGKACSCGCLKSKSEMECKVILSKYKVKFEPQKTFEGCIYKYKLRFDIYVPRLNTCIELDGGQHFHSIEFFGGEKGFKETQKKDAVKNKYCLDNNIKLLRIPYTQFDNIEQVLIDNKIIKR